MKTGTMVLAVIFAVSGAPATIAATQHPSLSVAAPADVGAALEILNALKPEDMVAPSPRLDQALDPLFPAAGAQAPCNTPEGLLSSQTLCEWTVPGDRTASSVPPDLFVSLSEAGLDSAVFWGSKPLKRAAWQCALAHSRPQTTICLPRALSQDRKTTLVREWKAMLKKINEPD